MPKTIFYKICHDIYYEKKRPRGGKEPPDAMSLRYADTQKCACAIHQNVPV